MPSPDARAAQPGESAADIAKRAAGALEAWLQQHHAGTAALIWVLDHATSGTWFGFAGMALTTRVAASGLGIALALGLAAGLMPAVGAYRARVTEMLRGV